ncbi:MAG TPA: substrate-binding domain-containing protein [Acidimicrobiia bacterium]
MRSTKAMAALLLAFVTACTTSTTTTSTTAAPGTTGTTAAAVGDLGLPVIDPLEVDQSVDVAIAGSSTVFPLSVAVLSNWIDEGGPEYTIDSIGSGGGIERFCVEGASDIANASRSIEEEEVGQCEAIDREPLEIRIGTDALSVVISKGNTFAQSLTLADLNAAFALTDADATWADVNPAFPAHPIKLYSPGTDSGTFSYFNEKVFPDEVEAEEPSPILANPLVEIVGEDDNITVRGVADDGCTEGDLSTTCAIGYFGFAYYQENSDVLTAASIDDVAPSAETVNDNSYEMSRPLFMYTAASVITEKPQVAEFIAYYLETVNSVIGEVGYFPAHEDDLQGAADALKAAAGW